MRTIALEEHFVSHAFFEHIGYDLGGQRRVEVSQDRAGDLGETRLRDMDEAGIDLQVISHVWPSYDPGTPELQIAVSTAANDQLAQSITAHPTRFAGFAALPMAAPEAAVDELNRTVGDLGFVGALVNGRPDERFLDHPSLFPILQRAAQLNVPIYLHPGLPSTTMRDELFSGFDPTTSYLLGTAAWGWHAEAGLHILRLIAAGIFDRLPTLKVIIGHMGEMVPFMLDRADEFLSPAMKHAGIDRGLADTFRSNVWVTTSGMFALPPAQLLLQTIGADRILFSVDYPFSTAIQGRHFLDTLPVTPNDRAKISHHNAETILNLTPSR